MIYLAEKSLAVGVGSCFNGFSIEKQVFWSISYSYLTKQTFYIVADLGRNILKIA